MRLLTLNIRFGAGSETPEKPGYDVPSSKAKILAVAEAIDAASPDIVALQEVNGARQAERIAGHLGMKSVYTRHPIRYALDFFEWGLAFCFRSRLRKVRNPTLKGPADARSGRTVLAVTLEEEEGPVTCVNVHFHPRGTAEQAAHLVGLFPESASPGIIMGDFNCSPDDDGLGALRDRWKDSCRAAATRAGREAEDIGTLVHGSARIDQILVDPRSYETIDAGLVPPEHRRVSDHIGYFADVLPVSAGGAD
jgi:endonuclease/exonuclease/phosphatase family metal-dependent hydrolase